MEIVIKREELIENMSIVGQVASKSPTIPILKYVKCNMKEDGTMMLTAFDGEMSIIKKFPTGAEVSQAIDFCINPSDLINILKTLKDDVVSLNLGEVICEIRHAKGSASLPIEPIESYPIVELEKDAPKYTFKVGQLTEWLRKASKFVAQDKLRPIIAGVNIYAKEGSIGVASSDGLFLFNDYLNVDTNEMVNYSGTLSTKAIAPLINMMQGEEEVVVSYGVKMLSFRTKDARLSCIKPVGNYPNFNAIIARRENTIKVVVDKADILDSLGRAMLSTQVMPLIHLSIAQDHISINSEDLAFNKKTHEECKCDTMGEGLDIGVKGSHLIECLNAINSDNVTLEFVAEDKPIFLYDEECPNKTVLTMPMQTKP